MSNGGNGGQMRLFESARQTLKKYADFSGRASREEFWLFFAFVIVANAVAGIVGALLGMRGILSGLVGLLLIVPQIAVAVRRLQVWPRTCRSLPAPAASAAGIRVPGHSAADRRPRRPRSRPARVRAPVDPVHEEGHDRSQPIRRGADSLFLRQLTTIGCPGGKPSLARRFGAPVAEW